MREVAVLPSGCSPLAVRFGQRVGQVNPAQPLAEVRLRDSPHLLEMIKQVLFSCGRQHGDAILLSFVVTHGDLGHGEVGPSSTGADQV